MMGKMVSGVRLSKMLLSDIQFIWYLVRLFRGRVHKYKYNRASSLFVRSRPSFCAAQGLLMLARPPAHRSVIVLDGSATNQGEY